jgi:REP element-mobilizing transposase RayT
MSKQSKKPTPLAYFITFTCYGARLHAGKKQSVDRCHNKFATPFVLTNPSRNKFVKNEMIETPYVLDAKRRELVLSTIIDVSAYHKWKLLAAHVRTNHVHFVIQSNANPNLIMNTIKAYASRYLNTAKIDDQRIKRWARHGSTRNLWDDVDVTSAIHYVVHEQGSPLAVFEYM